MILKTLHTLVQNSPRWCDLILFYSISSSERVIMERCEGKLNILKHSAKGKKKKKGILRR